MQESPRALSSDAPGRKRSRPNVRRTLPVVLVAILLFAAIGAAGYGLATHPGFAAALRDISIIALSLVTLVIGLFLVVLIVQLQSLIALLRDEIRPMLESANRTADTVRGTTSFLSDTVVRPVIAVAGYASGVGQTLRALTRSRRRSSSGGAPGLGPDQA